MNSVIENNPREIEITKMRQIHFVFIDMRYSHIVHTYAFIWLQSSEMCAKEILRMAIIGIGERESESVSNMVMLLWTSICGVEENFLSTK